MNQVTVLKPHISLNVQNVTASIEFYKKMLGIEPLKVRTGYAKFDVQNPPLNLALNEAPVKERGALSHLGLQVGATEDVLALRERWQDAFVKRFADDRVGPDGQDVGLRPARRRTT